MTESAPATNRPPDDEPPPGEAEKLLTIKAFCTMATGSAEQIAGISEEELLRDKDQSSVNRREIHKYEF